MKSNYKIIDVKSEVYFDKNIEKEATKIYIYFKNKKEPMIFTYGGLLDEKEDLFELAEDLLDAFCNQWKNKKHRV